MELTSSGVTVRSAEDACVLQYDDTLDGLFTAVFASYGRARIPTAVVGQQFQQTLGTYCETVITDTEKARRVERGIRRTMGEAAYEKIWTGFLSADPDKGTVLYRYIRIGMQWGRQVHRHLSDERVVALETLVGRVGREAHHWLQFARFSKRVNGAYYAEITPEHDVLALLMPHFTDRFCSQPFVIHDTRRQQAGVYDTRRWMVAPVEGEVLARVADDQWDCERLWKRFYDAVAIRERINPALRRQWMPKKYWHGLTEITTIDTAPRTALPSEISRAAVERLIDGGTVPLLTNRERSIG